MALRARFCWDMRVVGSERVGCGDMCRRGYSCRISRSRGLRKCVVGSREIGCGRMCRRGYRSRGLGRQRAGEHAVGRYAGEAIEV